MQSQSISNLINGQQLILRHVQRLRLQVTLETSNAKEKKKRRAGMKGELKSLERRYGVDH